MSALCAARTRDAAPGPGDPSEPLVFGPATQAAFELARRAARAELPVLVLGESGTGKELVAWTVHAASPRRAAPYVVFDCAAAAASLVEDQLFGHEAGAFTGAGGRRKGIFEEAEGGTVLLDEVGELPLAVQPKLLRVLEAKKVRRLGGAREIDVNVRIVAATHRDLDEMSADGRFRLDLLHRIGAFTMTLQPLRSRAEELLPFARHFLARAGAAAAGGTGAAPPVLLSPEAYGESEEARRLSGEPQRLALGSSRPDLASR